jgi:hypothetical protein
MPTAIANLSATDVAGLATQTAAALPVESAPLLQHAAADSALNMAVLPHAAHLSLLSDDGDLSLHVRVRDGSADVNVSGSMAPLFESRAPEVRSLLADQGLGLGSFATDHQGAQQHSQDRSDSASAAPNPHHPSPKRPTPTSGPLANASEEGRIHITA